MRYVLEVTIKRCKDFIDHGLNEDESAILGEPSMNSTASQSSSSGMGRRRRIAAKIKHRRHERLTQVTQPDVIHSDSCD